MSKMFERKIVIIFLFISFKHVLVDIEMVLLSTHNLIQ